MTAVALFTHKGRHCPERRPSIFRRMVAWLRKQAAPASHPMAGAATDGYACCEHCYPRCEEVHAAPCDFGCNDPVLGDKTIADVRAEYDGTPSPSFTQTAPTWTPSQLLSTGELTVLDEKVDAVLRPVNGRSLGDRPRLDREARSEQDRLEFVSSQMTERAARIGLPLLQRVRDGIRNLDEPGFGVDKCVADVLKGERQAQGLIA